MKPVEVYQSLQELEGVRWGETDPDASRLVTECHRLRCVPLRNFTVEDLRIMIGQEIGVKYLVPLALTRLEADPLAEGHCYPCDLLVNVLGVNASFWQARREWSGRVAAAAERAIALFPTVPEIASRTVTKAVNEAYGSFTRRVKPGLKPLRGRAALAG